MVRVYSYISYAIYGDVNSRSHIDILPSYYVHGLIEYPLG
jgi:hypothetical protein